MVIQDGLPTVGQPGIPFLIMPSSCCGSDVLVEGRVTKFYVCAYCGAPCSDGEELHTGYTRHELRPLFTDSDSISPEIYKATEFGPEKEESPSSLRNWGTAVTQVDDLWLHLRYRF